MGVEYQAAWFEVPGKSANYQRGSGLATHSFNGSEAVDRKQALLTHV